MTHTITTTREEVLASNSLTWLSEIMGECTHEPAEPDVCPNCLAYTRLVDFEMASAAASTVVNFQFTRQQLTALRAAWEDARDPMDGHTLFHQVGSMFDFTT